MTRRFDFDDYKIVFNGHPFKGPGYLLGLPFRPDKDMYGGRVLVCSKPPELSYVWLLNIVNERRNPITINGFIEQPDGSEIKLKNGVMSSYNPGPNRSGLYEFTFTFEVIDPSL